MNLLSGVSICPVPNIREKWEPASNLALSSGTTCEKLQEGPQTMERGLLFFPKDDWRVPTESELVVLLSRSRSEMNDMVWIFDIPELLRSKLQEIVVENFLSGRGQPATIYQYEYRDLVDEVIRYLEFSFFHISGDYSFELTVRNPGLRSTNYDPKYGTYIGLHFDNRDRQPINRRHLSLVRVGINLGNEGRHLVLINLTAMQIFNMLGLVHSRENYERFVWACPLGNMFMSAFPDYPVVKIALNPGEGYVAPTQNILHDGYTLRKTEPDINLFIRGNFLTHKHRD